MKCKSFWEWERKQFFLFYFNGELRAILHLPYLKQEKKAFLVIAHTFRFPENSYEKKSCYLVVRRIHDGLVVVEARQKKLESRDGDNLANGRSAAEANAFFSYFSFLFVRESSFFLVVSFSPPAASSDVFFQQEKRWVIIALGSLPQKKGGEKAT